MQWSDRAIRKNWPKPPSFHLISLGKKYMFYHANYQSCFHLISFHEYISCRLGHRRSWFSEWNSVNPGNVTTSLLGPLFVQCIGIHTHNLDPHNIPQLHRDICSLSHDKQTLSVLCTGICMKGAGRNCIPVPRNQISHLSCKPQVLCIVYLS